MGMGEVVDVIEITVTACFYIGGLLLLLNCGGLVEAFEPTTVTPLTAPSAVSPFSAALALQLRQRGGQSGGRRSERHRGQALAAADSGGDDLGEKYSNPLTALVGQFLPSGDAPSSSSSSSSSPNDDAFAAIDWDAPKAQGGIARHGCVLVVSSLDGADDGLSEGGWRFEVWESLGDVERPTCAGQGRHFGENGRAHLGHLGQGRLGCVGSLHAHRMMASLTDALNYKKYMQLKNCGIPRERQFRRKHIFAFERD